MLSFFFKRLKCIAVLVLIFSLSGCFFWPHSPISLEQGRRNSIEDYTTKLSATSSAQEIQNILGPPVLIHLFDVKECEIKQPINTNEFTQTYFTEPDQSDRLMVWRYLHFVYTNEQKVLKNQVVILINPVGEMVYIEGKDEQGELMQFSFKTTLPSSCQHHLLES